MYKQRLVGITPVGHSWFSVRNGNYDQKVGDVLTRAVRYKPRVYPNYELPEIIEERQTNLTIVAIKAYGQDLTTVGQGMTCLMALEGDTDFLNEEWNFE